tara:strand:+ start:22606 stop:23967 length:1362 start_codon:yes stop_codon:yes gene_type:complete
MSFIRKIKEKPILPSPFTIAIILTFLTFLIALLFTEKHEEGNYFLELISYWEKGIWNNNLIVFAFQMMLMLILGHTLALTNTANKIIDKITKNCNNSASAASLVCFLSILVSLFNWGLGLIFGAILSRKIGEYASKNKIKLNYPLIGAAGYSGLMVWHGGFSGSAPIKAAEQGHLYSLNSNQLISLPEFISLSETILCNMNIFITILLLLLIPFFMFYLGKKKQGCFISIETKKIKLNNIKIKGAEKLDHSKILSYFLSFLILGFCIYKAFILPEKPSLAVINPNYINLCLLGLSILLHHNFYNFTKAINSAIGGASGILIQFPLYFGIMGIMKDSGMVTILSDFFASISNENTFPVLTFISAGIVNIFVPSGGGQWAIQGPIILETASNLGISYSKCIMALAYGDQVTNMLQPFWALPLLGITGLQAREIFPYTLCLFFLGVTIFISGLLLF